MFPYFFILNIKKIFNKWELESHTEEDIHSIQLPTKLEM